MRIGSVVYRFAETECDMIASKWSVANSKILKRGEIAKVLSELHRKAA